jgi:hypothetical protein
MRTDVSEELIASILIYLVFLRTELQLLVTVNIFPSPLIFYRDDGGDMLIRNVGLKTATRCHIPEDGMLHSHRSENLKYYIALTGWAL